MRAFKSTQKQIIKFSIKNRPLFTSIFPLTQTKSRPQILNFSLLSKNTFTTKTETKTQTKDKKPEKPKNLTPEEKIGKSQSHQFQAETRELLNIVSRSIYTDKEVFLRELISNASDATEQARYILQTNPKSFEKCKNDLEIRIYTDSVKNTITIQDFGIGMTEKQLVSNLGTIARSGSKNFIKEMKASGDQTSVESRASSIIGQFGVGFYSAFMVSNNVEVYSKSATNISEMAHYWKSDGSGSYELAQAKNVSRGTKIVINLLKECSEFSDKTNIEKIIKKYSNFVQFPIFLNDKRVNVQGALWSEPPSSISNERYTEFYKYLTNAYDSPLDRLHFTTDVPISIQGLFYIPEFHTEKYGMSRMEHGVSVYSRKVLIKSKSKEILPDWMRFVKGVVDSEDLPLHISRENLQNSYLIKKINKFLVKRIISHLDTVSNKNPEKYKKFYKEYSSFLKEGVCSDIDNKDSISKLLRYESSKTKSGEFRSFDDYIASMPKAQNNIYYLVTSNRMLAESSPYYEAFKRKNTEVLFLYTAVDEFVMQSLSQHKKRKFVSIESKDVDTNDIQDAKSDDKKLKFKLSENQAEELCEWLEKKLPNRLKDVSITHRLNDSPAIIVGHESASVRGFMKLVNQENNFKMDISKQKMEINPNHPVIRGLFYSMNEDADLAVKVAEQLVDNCLIAAGLLDDPRLMLNRVNQLLAVAMDVEGIESEIEEEKKKRDVKKETEIKNKK